MQALCCIWEPQLDMELKATGECADRSSAGQPQICSSQARVNEMWCRYRIRAWGVEYMGYEGFMAAVKSLQESKDA
jgi:hypothetical protein